jgi:UDP-N-acetylmuramoylalanine--D-glutamate ligase
VAATRARRIILLKGSATEAFAADLRAAAARQGRSDPIEGVYDDFAAAIQRARELAAPGDVVLLSPGFTSFGLFLHEFDRGDQFRTLVRALPEPPEPR